MNKLSTALLGGTALVGAGLIAVPEVNAQSAALPGGVVAVQQSAARADAASFNNSATSGNCTTTQTANTVTITPPAGNFVYISSITAQQGSNATGPAAASVAAITSSNLTGSPAWIADANTGSTIIGAEVINQVFATGLKATAAGTAVTLTPATMASTYFCMQVSGWYSPL